MIFNGTISLSGDSDDSLPASFDVANGRFVIRTSDGSVLGDWPLTEADIRRQGDGFVAVVEGERLLLSVTDPEGFGRALRRGQSSGSSEHAIVRTSSEPEADAINWPVIGAVVGLIAGVGLAAAVLVNLGSSNEEATERTPSTPSPVAATDPCAEYGEQMGQILIAVVKMTRHEMEAVAAQSINAEAIALSPASRASYAGAWDLLVGEVGGIQLDYRLLPDYGLASQDAFSEALDAYAGQYRTWAKALREPDSDISLGLINTALLMQDEASSKMKLATDLVERECASQP